MKEETLIKYKKCEELFLRGMSLTQICVQEKIGRKWFTKWLKSQGHEITNPSRIYNYDENFFETIDTEEKAYWLGFLYADGNVAINKNSKTGKFKGYDLDVCIKKSDEEHLNKFKKCLKANVPITYRKIILGEKTHEACRVIINSTKLCKDLINKGCVPNKTHILTFPTEDIVPNNLLRHFVRGYIDGDGYLGFYEKNKKTRFGAIGTKFFLEGLKERMGWQDITIKGDVRSEIPTSNNTFEVFGKENIHNKLKQLYENSSIYLTRKYEIYKKCDAVLNGDI